MPYTIPANQSCATAANSQTHTVHTPSGASAAEPPRSTALHQARAAGWNSLESVKRYTLRRDAGVRDAG